ncbi:hypothetical protein HY249_00765 [Candidatus Azambacteria bacterium]|nr:hypothetical protein [Candidatus Azambacteria bacterium]
MMYVAVLGIMISVIASFLSDVLKTNSKSQAKQAVSNNITLALSTISSEIRYAKNIYTPTSVLSSNAGQLSLETELNAVAGHATTFVDFYLDNGVVYEKREGSASSRITSDRVFVTKLRFEKYTATSGEDTVRTIIDGRINTASARPEDQATISLTSTSALRGNY